MNKITIYNPINSGKVRILIWNLILWRKNSEERSKEQNDQHENIFKLDENS